MPAGPVARALEYVLLLFTFSLANTFVWWMAAALARVEYDSLLSALACSMRFFFYAICLLCILVALRYLGLEPADPRNPLFGWIHIAGSMVVSAPCAWRAFRERGVKLILGLTIFWGVTTLLLWLAMRLMPGLQGILLNLPGYLSRA